MTEPDSYRGATAEKGECSSVSPELLSPRMSRVNSPRSSSSSTSLTHFSRRPVSSSSAWLKSSFSRSYFSGDIRICRKDVILPAFLSIFSQANIEYAGYGICRPACHSYLSAAFRRIRGSAAFVPERHIRPAGPLLLQPVFRKGFCYNHPFHRCPYVRRSRSLYRVRVY